MSTSIGPLEEADWTERYERLRAAAYGPPGDKANGMRLFLREGMVGWMFAWVRLVAPARPMPRATSNLAAESGLHPEPGTREPALAKVAEILARMLLHRVLGTTS